MAVTIAASTGQNLSLLNVLSIHQVAGEISQRHQVIEGAAMAEASGWAPLYISALTGPMRIDRCLIAGDPGALDPQQWRILIEGAFTREQIVTLIGHLGGDADEMLADPSFPITVVDGLIDAGGLQAPAGSPANAFFADMEQPNRLLSVRFQHPAPDDENGHLLSGGANDPYAFVPWSRCAESGY